MAVAAAYNAAAPAAVPAAALVVPFNLITAGTGVGFNPFTGVFVAPLAGLYLVNYSVGLVFALAGNVTTSIVSNGVSVGSSTSTAPGAGAYGAASSGVVFLQQGSSLWIQAQASAVGVATLQSGTFPNYFSNLSVVSLF